MGPFVVLPVNPGNIDICMHLLDGSGGTGICDGTGGSSDCRGGSFY